MSRSTLMKLRQEEREVRKNLIMDAAIRLFAARPFNQVGMRDIAAEAGLSPASIYRYFTDRDDLFVEVFARESSGLERKLLALTSQEGETRLEELAEAYIESLLEHDAFFQMMSYFMVGGGISDESLERFNAMERRLLDLLEQKFRRAGLSESPRLLAHSLFASLNGLLITFRNYPGRKPEDTRRHIMRLTRLIASLYKPE